MGVACGYSFVGPGQPQYLDPAVDAFGRVRVSAPYTLLGAKHLGDKQPVLWDEESYNGASAATHSVANATVTLATSSDTHGVIRQTFMRFGYQPGKSQRITLTGRLTKEANIRKRLGYFETSHAADSVPQNGIFYEVAADGTVSWNIAKNGTVTETVTQANWEDPMDGSGLSRVTLDTDKVLIWLIDFEWLGVGSVRVGFVIENEIVYCHHFKHSNVSTSVYMSSPNLPVCYSIYQDGSGSGSLDQICCSVESEGGQEAAGIQRCIDLGSNTTNAHSAGSTYALLGIRLQSDHPGLIVTPEALSALATTNDAFRLALILNPTVAGTFTYSDLTNSGVQRALGDTSTSPESTNTVTGGTLLWSTYVSQQNRSTLASAVNLPRLGLAIDGTQDTLVLCAEPVTNGLDIVGSLQWREQ